MGSARYSGVYPMLYAFWGDGGRLDREAMRLQVDHCIAAGAHGITVLGLVTEIHKMDINERLALVEMVGDLIGKRVPYAVTVGEPSLQGQIAFSRAAAAAGADWVILQPPSVRGTSEADIIRFFGTVADSAGITVGVQNNPVNLDVWLSVQGLVTLARNHSNITLLKGEGNSVDIARVIAETGHTLDVFGGHGGVEFLSLLRSGGAGLIPAPDVLAIQVRIFELFRDGSPEALAEAGRLHQVVLPLIVFMTRSVPTMLCYGKRFLAKKLGLGEPVDRLPAATPTNFGLREIESFAGTLSALEADIASRCLLQLDRNEPGSRS